MIHEGLEPTCLAAATKLDDEGMEMTYLILCHVIHVEQRVDDVRR
jgi:hypothetical protein